MNKTYEIITNKLIKRISETKLLPWNCPWHKTGLLDHCNAITKHKYTGVNAFFTQIVAISEGYECSDWMTFKQIQEKGYTLKKGSKSVPIVFFTRFEIEENDKKEKIPVAKYYNVFNFCQTNEYIAQPKSNHTPLPKFDLKDALSVMENKIPSITHDGGNKAYYHFKNDSIHLPDQSKFKSKGSYYATLFHEITHSTGHKTRLNRNLDAIKNFGDHNYSKEELIAEMGAMFLCEYFKIEKPIDNSAAYLDGWLKAIKAKPKILIESASKAYKALEYLTSKD